MTSKIVNCLYVYQRNVFLEELKNNLDCSCILVSLVKICFDKKYRTISGLENLIQKEWFLVGHPFNKRYQPASQFNLNSDEFIMSNENDGKRRSSLNSMTSIKTTTATNIEQANADQPINDMAPSFLLFLDCLFQMTIQYPNEFEYNEFYLINLWDYSCSGLSFSYSFNGIAEWSYYLNNQNFIDSSNLTLGSFLKGTVPKFEDGYLKYIFDTNNYFWLEHLTQDSDKINSHFLNKNFNSSDVVLIPNDKIYLIKFWSRCYLRWLEKYHCYNSFDEDLHHAANASSTKQNQNTVYAPTRPPPLPPKPQKQAPLEKSESINLETNNSNEAFLKNNNTVAKKDKKDQVIEEFTSF
jgi:hypothetical protein